MSSWAVILQGPYRGLVPARHPKPVKAEGGGAGGIRTLDRALQPYNGLANRRLQPLGHSSVRADMPDARARRKRQIRAHFIACFEARLKIGAILAVDSIPGISAPNAESAFTSEKACSRVADAEL